MHCARCCPMRAFEFLFLHRRFHLNSGGVGVNLKDTGMASWFEQGFDKLQVPIVACIRRLEDCEVIAIERGHSVKYPAGRRLQDNTVLQSISSSREIRVEKVLFR